MTFTSSNIWETEILPAGACGGLIMTVMHHQDIVVMLPCFGGV